MAKKVLIIGLDCAHLVWFSIDGSTSSPLCGSDGGRNLWEARVDHSTHHDSGLDIDGDKQESGYLGFYGIRNRQDYSYDKMILRIRYT